MDGTWRRDLSVARTPLLIVHGECLWMDVIVMGAKPALMPRRRIALTPTAVVCGGCSGADYSTTALVFDGGNGFVSSSAVVMQL